MWRFWIEFGRAELCPAEKIAVVKIRVTSLDNRTSLKRLTDLNRWFPGDFSAARMLLGDAHMDLRKVYGGTPVGQVSQCDTCVYARIIRGYSESEKITLCDRIFQAVHIPFRVRECSDYVDKRLPCIEDLEEIAWQLRSKSAGKRAGFVGVEQIGSALENDEQAEADGQREPAPEEIPAARHRK
jgi:hypothetical protein